MSQTNIGISIGRTSCCVVGYKNNEICTIPNEFGDFTTPAYVSINEKNEIIVGKNAEKSLINSNGFHSLIGLPSEHQEVKDFIMNNKNLKINIDSKFPEIILGDKKFTAIEIYMFLLMKLKEISENYIGNIIKNCVISCPYYMDDQREEIKNVCKNAGLNCMRILNNSKAACISYDLDRIKLYEPKNILVIEYGKNDINLTILELEDEIFEIKSNKILPNLGSKNIDFCLFEYLNNQLETKFPSFKEHKLSEIRNSKFLNYCTSLKHTLSQQTEVLVDFEGIFNEISNFSLTISRAKFDSLISHEITKIISEIKNFVKNSGLSHSNLYNVICVGGGSKLLKFQQELENWYEKPIKIQHNSEQTIAIGCYKMSQILNENFVQNECCRYGLYAKNTNLQIPLENILWDIKIIENFMEFKISQTFINNSKNSYEVIYYFPIEQQIAITNLQIFINGKTIIGKILDRTKAQEKYIDAIASGDSAYLCEYDENDKDLLKFSIGNLLPGQKTTISITCIKIIELDENNFYNALIPAVMTPKYQNSIENSNLQNYFYSKSTSYQSDLQTSWNLNCEIFANSGITDILCSHKININKNSTKTNCKINLSEKIPNIDFYIKFKTANMNTPQIILQKSEQFPYYAGAIAFCPNFDMKKCENGPGEYIFVIDCSGSMTGKRIEMAKEAAPLFIEKIPENSLFNIIVFGTNFIKYFPESIPNSKENILFASSKISEIHADMDGTEIYPVLESIYKNPVNPLFPRNIFLLTDGAVSCENEVIELIKKNKGITRVHTFGIGNGVSRSLIKNAAKVGNGCAQFVLDSEKISGKVLDQLKKVSKRSLVIKEIVWPKEIEIIKSSMPNIAYYGESITIFGFFNKWKENEIVKLITIDSLTKEEKIFSAITNSLLNPYSFIYQIAARQILLDYNLPLPEEIYYATTYNILSANTAFIIVDKNIDKENVIKNEMKTYIMPIPEPQYSGHDLLLLDITPLDLGIEICNGLFYSIIPRNSTIPTKKEATVEITNIPGNPIILNIYEGQRKYAKDNNFLDSMSFPIPTSKSPKIKMNVKFDLDANSILTVTAKNIEENIENKKVITSQKNRLTKEEIEKMINDAEKYAPDKDLIEKVELKNSIEILLFKIKDLIAKIDLTKLDFSDMENIKKINEIIEENLKILSETFDLKEKKYYEILENEIMQKILIFCGNIKNEINLKIIDILQGKGIEEMDKKLPKIEEVD